MLKTMIPSALVKFDKEMMSVNFNNGYGLQYWSKFIQSFDTDEKYHFMHNVRFFCCCFFFWIFESFPMNQVCQVIKTAIRHWFNLSLSKTFSIKEKICQFYFTLHRSDFSFMSYSLLEQDLQKGYELYFLKTFRKSKEKIQIFFWNFPLSRHLIKIQAWRPGPLRFIRKCVTTRFSSKPIYRINQSSELIQS